MAEKARAFIIDFIIAMIALVVLAFIVMPNLTTLVSNTQSAADTASLKVLNDATVAYRILEDIGSGDVFAGVSTDAGRMQALVDAQLLRMVPAPQQKGAAFQWNKDEQIWVLLVQGEAAPLTPLGSTFTEISSAMIQLELDRKAATGSYGRSWGDYAYTDLGLDPDEWKAPVDHIHYIPGGSMVMAAPEAGYTFYVADLSGAVRELPASYHWSLVYDCEGGAWYYHSIEAGNEIDISTLQIVRG